MPHLIQDQDLKLAGCEDESACMQKVVSLEGFQFLDRTAVRAQAFRPMSEFIYGGTHMRLSIANLPAIINATDLLVEFHVNVTAFKIDDSSSSVREVHVQIPKSSRSQSVKIRIHWLEGPPLQFEEEFRYLPAPRPTIARILPQTASIETPTKMRISVRKFPMLSALSDLKVYFQFESGEEKTKAYAVVQDYTHSGSKESAMRDLEINILSPVGSSVREGTPKIIVFNQKFGETNSAKLDSGGVKFIDPLNPQLSRMTSSDGSIGIDEISVPMSGAELSIMVDKAPRQADVPPISYSLLVGGVVQDIVSADVSDGREATIVFSTFPQLSAGAQQGVVIFGEAVDTCIEACCSTCPSKTVTFNLIFFDDTMPMLTALSDLNGPETGGDVVKVEISNFPILNHPGDVSVSFLAGTEREYIEGVSVQSSTSKRTRLLLVTPVFNNIDFDTSVEINIEPTVDAALSVSFSYLGKFSCFFSVQSASCE